MITLTLKPEEVQIIIDALANRPYGEVYKLIPMITETTNKQIEEQKKSETIKPQ